MRPVTGCGLRNSRGRRRGRPRSRSWWQRLQQERGLTVSGLATSEDVTQSYVTRILRLAFLSPDVVKSIMTGRQPAWLDSGALCNRDSISHDWDEQKQNFLLGRAS